MQKAALVCSFAELACYQNLFTNMVDKLRCLVHARDASVPSVVPFGTR